MSSATLNRVRVLLTLLAVVACLVVLAAVRPSIGGQGSAPSSTPWSDSSSVPAATGQAARPSGPARLDSVPAKVYDVLAVVDRTGRAPEGFRGGTQFMNDGRGGGQVLPRRDSAGRSIAYTEWDVNPYTGANRGTERLVTGSDGSAWYTGDHYDTFVRIR